MNKPNAKGYYHPANMGALGLGRKPRQVSMAVEPCEKSGCKDNTCTACQNNIRRANKRRKTAR